MSTHKPPGPGIVGVTATHTGPDGKPRVFFGDAHGLRRALESGELSQEMADTWRPLPDGPPPDNIAQGSVEGDLDYRHSAAFGKHVEDTLGQFEVFTDPKECGATHRLRYQDGTEELLAVEGDVTLEKLP